MYAEKRFDVQPEIRKDNEVQEMLRKAKEMIREPSHWCKGAEFRCAMGINQYCMIGALRRVADNYALEMTARSVLQYAIKRSSIPQWNDHRCRTHAQVMRAFDRAIERAASC